MVNGSLDVGVLDIITVSVFSNIHHKQRRGVEKTCLLSANNSESLHTQRRGIASCPGRPALDGLPRLIRW